MHDEHSFEPILFMRPAVFRQRMQTLSRLRVPVVSLADGVRLLASDSVRNGEVIITVDDGWSSTLSIAAPILQEYGFPACVYVTTYYAQRHLNVFNIVIWYMLWRTDRRTATLSGLNEELDGVYDLSSDRMATGRRWIDITGRDFPSSQREGLLGRFAEALGLEISEVLRDDRFKLMDQRGVAMLARDFDVDVQLHTHRHNLPTDSAEAVCREIDENRRLLEAWTGKSCTHFCYPSGKYFSQHPAWLLAAGVASATTCDEGLNDSRTPPMLLKRYLDRDTWEDVEFEAAVSGFSELLSHVTKALGR